MDDSKLERLKELEGHERKIREYLSANGFIQVPDTAENVISVIEAQIACRRRANGSWAQAVKDLAKEFDFIWDGRAYFEWPLAARWTRDLERIKELEAEVAGLKADKT